MDDEANIEDWMDFGIGDSMDGCGRLRDERPEPRARGGVMHAIYPRHQASTCAGCGKSIRECDTMYTRDGSAYFCDPSHERRYRQRQGGA